MAAPALQPTPLLIVWMGVRLVIPRRRTRLRFTSGHQYAVLSSCRSKDSFIERPIVS
jgi:hypothetical protein